MYETTGIYKALDQRLLSTTTATLYQRQYKMTCHRYAQTLGSGDLAEMYLHCFFQLFRQFISHAAHPLSDPLTDSQVLQSQLSQAVIDEALISLIIV